VTVVETILVISTALLWILMLFNILLTVGLGRRINSRLPRLETLKVGQNAPNFTAWTLTGDQVSLADYAGRTVAFVFMSPNCRPCREQLLELVNVQSRSRQNGIEVVIVSDAGEAETISFISEGGAQLPVLIAPRNRTSFLSDFKAHGTPSYCVVDAQGKVLAADLGAFHWEGNIEAQNSLNRVIGGGMSKA
jgi:peroxiredoxin